jgi:hypothetical protein
MTRDAREMDARAFEVLQRRGLTAVDIEPYRAEWEDVARQTRARLSGRLFPADLLHRVEQIARANP